MRIPNYVTVTLGSDISKRNQRPCGFHLEVFKGVYPQSNKSLAMAFDE